MKLSRRAALAAGAGGLCLAGLGLVRRPRRAGDGAETIIVEARPIRAFRPADPERHRFGALTFRSGLDLRSAARRFGGFSGLWRSPDGTRLVAVSDRAQWLAAGIGQREGRLDNLHDAILTPVLGPRGPLAPGPYEDVEALAVGQGVAYLAVERVHAILRFQWAGDRAVGGGAPLALPTEIQAVPRNKGLEALAVAPVNGSLGGALVGVAERARWGDDAPTRGFILTGPMVGGLP